MRHDIIKPWRLVPRRWRPYYWRVFGCPYRKPVPAGFDNCTRYRFHLGEHDTPLSAMLGEVLDG